MGLAHEVGLHINHFLKKLRCVFSLQSGRAHMEVLLGAVRYVVAVRYVDTAWHVDAAWHVVAAWHVIHPNLEYVGPK